MKKRIAFESNPDMACNTYPVYKEMLARGLNKRYEFVWLVDRPEDFADVHLPNVRFVQFSPKTKMGYIKKHLVLARAQCLISCNRYFRKYHRKQFAIYLGHGSNMKTTKGLYQGGIRENCDFMLSQSPMFDPINETEWGVPQEKLVHLGFPRNDVLVRAESSPTHMSVGGAEFDKVVMWLPTYRQMNSGSYRDSDLGLPILREKTDFERLNQFLQGRNMLLLLKPHPVQETSVLFVQEMTNIRLLRDDQLRQNGVQLYEVLAGCDALLTDYSSVYYDFLLTGRPIGLTQDDLAEYRERRGFALDYDQWIKGWPILKVEDLIAYLDSVSQNQDPYLQARVKTLEATNLWQDANSTKRVVDFIIEHAGLEVMSASNDDKDK